MQEFKTGEWFLLSGKGPVFYCNPESDVWSNDIRNQFVLIEGQKYKVLAVESNGKKREEDPVRGILFSSVDTIGILVKE